MNVRMWRKTWSDDLFLICGSTRAQSKCGEPEEGNKAPQNNVLSICVLVCSAQGLNRGKIAHMQHVRCLCVRDLVSEGRRGDFGSTQFRTGEENRKEERPSRRKTLCLHVPL